MAKDQLRRLVIATVILGSCTKQVSEPKIYIQFPPGWREVTPNSSFTLKKATAPTGYASIAVMRRDGLWAGDGTSASDDDAWTALDRISAVTFERRFERNDPTGNQSPTVLVVKKTELGGEHAIYVEYELADREKGLNVRIHSYLLLHGHKSYAVAMATRASAPTAHRGEMEASAQTFRLRDRG